jgi:hypothetical protein
VTKVKIEAVLVRRDLIVQRVEDARRAHPGPRMSRVNRSSPPPA